MKNIFLLLLCFSVMPIRANSTTYNEEDRTEFCREIWKSYLSEIYDFSENAKRIKNTLGVISDKDAQTMLLKKLHTDPILLNEIKYALNENEDTIKEIFTIYEYITTNTYDVFFDLKGNLRNKMVIKSFWTYQCSSGKKDDLLNYLTE